MKYIIIAFCFLFSLIFYTSGETNVPAYNFTKNDIISNNATHQNGNISVTSKEQENSIVYSNTQNHEISSLTNDRKDLNNSFSNKTSAQNKILQNAFNIKYNKLYWSISHKISPYLRNEICTRAP